MIASARPRLRLPAPRGALPLALLLLALSSVFVFGNDRSLVHSEASGAHRSHDRGQHGWISLQTLTIAANLSAEHYFLGYLARWRDQHGEPAYWVYNRFPPSAHGVIALAIRPFGDDFPRAVRAARLLMLAFFAAAAVLAYLSLVRLLGDRRIALAATLLACSSHYLLFYNDMISAEASTNLFGVMLAFHGMVLFAQEGRFRQLLVKTAVALLLGWHAVGLVAAFVPLAPGRELVPFRGRRLRTT